MNFFRRVRAFFGRATVEDHIEKYERLFHELPAYSPYFRHACTQLLFDYRAAGRHVDEIRMYDRLLRMPVTMDDDDPNAPFVVCGSMYDLAVYERDVRGDKERGLKIAEEVFRLAMIHNFPSMADLIKKDFGL